MRVPLPHPAPATSSRARLALVLLLCLLLPSFAARAGQQDFGAYTVHYSAVNSTFLKPEIAAQYGIVRGERRAFLNVAVLRILPGGGTRPVTAAVSGVRGNLLGQGAPIEFREIREGEAVYYIGEFEFSNAENLHFELEIQPEGQGPVLDLKWASRLYFN